MHEVVGKVVIAELARLLPLNADKFVILYAAKLRRDFLSAFLAGGFQQSSHLLLFLLPLLLFSLLLLLFLNHLFLLLHPPFLLLFFLFPLPFLSQLISFFLDTFFPMLDVLLFLDHTVTAIAEDGLFKLGGGLGWM